LSLLRATYTSEPRVRIVAKENGGQLSAFNVGLAHATGDVVYFLDADDRYRPEHVATTLPLYEQGVTDFVIAGVEVFGTTDAKPRPLQPERNLGCSTLAALLSNSFVGGPTSSLSMRRWVADRMLPCPLEEDWRTRADDVLVLGGSIVGARKYQLHTPQVEYRVHGHNNHTGRARGAEQKLRHGLALNRLVQWFANRSGYNLEVLPRMLHREFATLEHPTVDEWWQYTKMSWRARLPLLVRARHFGETTLYYWQQRLGRGTAHRASPPAPEGMPAATQTEQGSNRRLAG
jgi:glycosyltransferase involved in cell wall biosynthesis